MSARFIMQFSVVCSRCGEKGPTDSGQMGTVADLMTKDRIADGFSVAIQTAKSHGWAASVKAAFCRDCWRVERACSPGNGPEGGEA